jgi:hypothetical protein
MLLAARLRMNREHEQKHGQRRGERNDQAHVRLPVSMT